MQPRAVDVHDEFLIARATVAGTLEDQSLSVVTEIGFRVLSAIRELTDIPEVAFTRGWRDADDGGRVGAGGERCSGEQGKQEGAM